MTNITKMFNYEGNKVTFRNDEGVLYVNATEMAKPFSKIPNEYLRLPSTKELLNAITAKSRISENQNTKSFLDELSKVRKSTLADLVIVTKKAESEVIHA